MAESYIEVGKIRESLIGISIGYVTQMEKIWKSFQAIGAIAFAHSYSLILIEIQVWESVKSFILGSMKQNEKPGWKHKKMSRKVDKGGSKGYLVKEADEAWQS
ncbi:Amino acid permease 3 [Forsythia ovata]|uniref:Amino acid permease 3 n=1 Tax=Forsythia ovata TaxID=205694 RepID=A0ABD1S8S1_9LAMI